MIVYYLFITLLCLWSFGFRKESDGDYLSKDQGNAVKGIFILMVLLFHAHGYVRDAGYAYDHWSDPIFLEICAKFGQLIVVMFLFFSGYGVMSAIRDRGGAYVKAMPRHRMLNVLLNFDVAVICYALVQLLIGQVFPIRQYFLSFIAWDSIGNSNWYIFVILLCYAATWASAKCFKSGWKVLALTVVMLCVVYALLFQCKPVHWYNTMIAYPLGMAVCLGKKQLDDFGKTIWYWLALGVGFICLAMTYIHHEDPYSFVFSFRSLVYASVMVLLLMKVKVGNPALNWLGKNLFPLYIFHRLPMILLAHFDPWGITAGCPVLFVALSFVLTLLLVPLVNKIQVRL